MRIGDRRFEQARGPFVVGIINLSPESPNRDSVVGDPAAAVARARALASDGADLIDVGGRSTNPAAPPVSWATERDRVVPAVKALKDGGFLVSVDTWDPRVALAAADVGADLINDSGGFHHPDTIALVAERALPVVIPFLNAPTPLDASLPAGPDPMQEVMLGLQAALTRARAAGVDDVLVDPGIGYEPPGVDPNDFGVYQKRMLTDLGRLVALGRPVFAAVLRRREPTATAAIARTMADAGVSFLRCHDPNVVTSVVRPSTREASPRS